MKPWRLRVILMSVLRGHPEGMTLEALFAEMAPLIATRNRTYKCMRATVESAIQEGAVYTIPPDGVLLYSVQYGYSEEDRRKHLLQHYKWSLEHEFRKLSKKTRDDLVMSIVQDTVITNEELEKILMKKGR